MAAFNFVNDFKKDLAEGVHKFSSHTLKLALSNTAPGSESSDPTGSGNGLLANVTEIAYTNVSEGANPTISTSSTSTESSGTYQYTLNADPTITASGGAVAGFRYIYVYNDGTTEKTNPLIGYWDYGSSLVLNDGDSLTINVDTTNNVLIEI